MVERPDERGIMCRREEQRRVVLYLWAFDRIYLAIWKFINSKNPKHYTWLSLGSLERSAFCLWITDILNGICRLGIV